MFPSRRLTGGGRSGQESGGLANIAPHPRPIRTATAPHRASRWEHAADPRGLALSSAWWGGCHLPPERLRGRRRPRRRPVPPRVPLPARRPAVPRPRAWPARRALWAASPSRRSRPQRVGDAAQQLLGTDRADARRQPDPRGGSGPDPGSKNPTVEATWTPTDIYLKHNVYAWPLYAASASAPATDDACAFMVAGSTGRTSPSPTTAPPLPWARTARRCTAWRCICGHRANKRLSERCLIARSAGWRCSGTCGRRFGPDDRMAPPSTRTRPVRPGRRPIRCCSWRGGTPKPREETGNRHGGAKANKAAGRAARARDGCLGAVVNQVAVARGGHPADREPGGDGALGRHPGVTG